MKYVLGIILAAALAWAGYWVYAARTVDRNLTTWLEARAAEGWVVSWDTLETGGFPYRFDTTITALELADPATGIAWRSPEFRLHALSYRPQHIIAAWPQRQTLATPLETIAVTSTGMQASMQFRPGLALEVEEAIFEFDGLGLASSGDWQASLAEGLLAARQTEGERASYDIAFTASEVALPDRMQRLAAKGGLAGDRIELLNLDATVGFDRPWDRTAIEESRPQPRSVDLRDMRVEWGELDLRMAGELEIDSAGQPAGKLTVKATNWREILELARRSGTLNETLAQLIERGLQTVAGLSGNPRTIDLPLEFSGGRMTLAGFIPLGSAPNFHLR